MLAYVIRRLLIGLVTLVLISFLIYGLIRAMPGDPTQLTQDFENPDRVLTLDQVQEMRRAFGLDRHWTVAYLEWFGRTLAGDLGNSLSRRAPVIDIILTTLGPTLLLSVTSLCLAYLLSVPLGIYSARRSGKSDERILSVFLYVLYSLPSYVVAILLLLLLGVRFQWLPLFGMWSPEHESLSFWGKGVDLIRHMILPVACYTYGSLAYYTRFVRSNLQEVLRQDYIRTARAKGLPERIVLWRHAFRNTLIPFVTLMGLSLPALLGGSVILEKIFSWPGMGQLFFEAIDARDYTLIMGLTMMFSVLVVVGTLLADILYAVVDPRISYS